MSKRFKKAQELTNKYRFELHPCSYCGNTDVRIFSSRGIFTKEEEFFVGCTTKNCDCGRCGTDIENLVKEWNLKHDARRRTYGGNHNPKL